MATETMLPRYAGVLLHPSSLPSKYGIGDFGSGAYDFIDFLKESGQSIWQVLPFGPTGYGDSPYQSFSAFAGQPLFISPEVLLAQGLLLKQDLQPLPNFSDDAVDYGYVLYYKNMIFHRAYEHFKETNDAALKAEFEDFCEREKDWLNDYALFMVCKDMQDGVCFLEWAPELRNPTARKKSSLLRSHKDEVDYYRFLQFLFTIQWDRVKAYANARGIRIVGDIPIFVSLDSAEMWAHPELFCLTSDGYPSVVAGVPPDYFSETGQLWGNPLYNWDYHKKTGYAWWIQRIQKQLERFDMLRIDHFRGFESYWAIPYGEKTAIQGEWLPGPGTSLFHAIAKKLGDDLPIIAEDLGIITPEVTKLRDTLQFPGMKVLQFAFNDPADNDLLPFRFTTTHCICYTGTHDNDTTLGWYMSLPEKLKDRVRLYLNTDGNNIHWDMIRCAMSSIAQYAIYPMQDLLGFGSDCRMNTPSTPSGNWTFRVRGEHFNSGLAAYLKTMTKLFGRYTEEADPSDVESTDIECANTESTKVEIDTLPPETEVSTAKENASSRKKK